MKQQGGLLLRSREGDPELVGLRLPEDAAPGQACCDHLLDLRVGKRLGVDAVKPGRRFAIGQQLDRAHAVAPDRDQEIERLG